MKKTIPLLLLTLLLLQNCEPSQSEEMTPPAYAQKVGTLHPTQETFEETITLAGEVLPFQDITVASEVSGKVLSLTPLGKYVKKGEILVQLDDSLLKAKEKEAEANLTQKLANLKKTEALLEKKATTRQQYIFAKTTYDMAEAQLAQVKEQRAKTLLTSPINGKVVTHLMDPGEYALPGTPLLRVVQIDPLKVSVGVPEEAVGAIREGEKAWVRIPALAIQREGKISFVSNTLDPSTRTLPIEVLLPNRDHRIKGGMMAEVTLIKKRWEKVLTLPMEAVVVQDGVEGVWLVKDNHATFQPVMVTSPHYQRVAVLQGLTEKAEVVIQGQGLLEEGMLVEVVPQK